MITWDSCYGCRSQIQGGFLHLATPPMHYQVSLNSLSPITLSPIKQLELSSIWFALPFQWSYSLEMVRNENAKFLTRSKLGLSKLGLSSLIIYTKCYIYKLFVMSHHLIFLYYWFNTFRIVPLDYTCSLSFTHMLIFILIEYNLLFGQIFYK